MSFERFMKRNKKQRANAKYVATASLTESDGSPVVWEIKPITTRESEDLRDECTIDVPVAGKPNMFRPKLVTKKYLAKLLAKSVVYPDLMNAELQDSYGVNTPEALIVELVDDPAEYNAFVNFVQNLNGFENLQGKVNEAKN